MKQENAIRTKSFELSLTVIRIYKYLKDKREYDFARQILRSGTSVGANVEEAQGGQSKRDFLMKISLAYKEARETKFWLRLLEASNYLRGDLLVEAMYLTDEVLKLLGTIQKTTKNTIKFK